MYDGWLRQNQLDIRQMVGQIGQNLNDRQIDEVLDRRMVRWLTGCVINVCDVITKVHHGDSEFQKQNIQYQPCAHTQKGTQIDRLINRQIDREITRERKIDKKVCTIQTDLWRLVEEDKF